jgi:putative hydrolase of the HAD superfamily
MSPRKSLGRSQGAGEARSGVGDVSANGVRVNTLFLDAGGVLIDPNWLRISQVLGKHGVSVDPEVLAAAEPHAKKEIDRAALVQASKDAGRGLMYLNLVLTHAGIELGSATEAAIAELSDYHARYNLWEAVPEEVVPVLRELRRASFGLVVVSNANGTLRAHIERLGLAPYFDHVLDSSEVQVEKPDPRIFAIALARSGARAESALHLGDLFHVDVMGARAAGIRAVLLDRAGLYADYACERVASLGELSRNLLSLGTDRGC